MLEGEKAVACVQCAPHKQSWRATRYNILVSVRNIEDEVRKKSTWSDWLSDGITAFCGNMSFFYVHVAWFAWWVWYNMQSEYAFDPYPFGFLTLIVSLEAIILATFILISQNRENRVNNWRSELHYQIDLKSAKALAEIKSIIAEMNGKKE